VLGKDHPDTLMTIVNLAASLQQQGKHAEAEAIHQLADLKSEHPQDRLDTSTRQKRKAEHKDNWGLGRSS
jgi:Tetratricopeptide repeat